MRRLIDELDQRCAEGAVILGTHPRIIAQDYSMSELSAVFKAYGRLHGVVSDSEREPYEDEVAQMEALKANWLHGVKP